ncbi:MAG: hypothetical protein AAFV53_02705 [Myxococcota bacterium]
MTPRELFDRAETPEQQILFLDADGDCPSIPGSSWSEQRLFPGGSGRLSRYCVYTHPGPDPSDIAQLEALRLEGTLEPDRKVVVPAAVSDLQDALAPSFLRRTRAAMGTLRHAGADGAAVELAVLDNGPTGDGEPSQYLQSSPRHGYTLLNLARMALCADNVDKCPVTIRSRPVLDRDNQTRGTWTALAGQLHGLREQWQADDTRLVINLSLGWNPLHTPPGRALPLGAQAVYDALREAQCQGVLILAAAGNRSGGPRHQRGLIYPAAWMDASPLQACEAVLSPKEVRELPRGRDAEPLLYAVGGIGVGQTDLPLARPSGRPPWVAFGEHAVAVDPDREQSPPLTGTSVSTLVVAAVAAATWKNIEGEGGPTDVMRSVFGQGDHIGSADTQWSPDDSGRSVLINLCDIPLSSTQYACAGEPRDPGVIPLQPDQNPLALFDNAASQTTLQLQPYTHASCTAATWQISGTEPIVVCPEENYFSQDVLSDWVFPQPPDEGCPVCTITKLTGPIESTLTLRLTGLSPAPHSTLVVMTSAGPVEYDLGGTLSNPAPNGHLITLNGGPEPIINAQLIVVDGDGVLRIFPLAIMNS